MKRLFDLAETLVWLTQRLSAILLAVAAILVFYQVITRSVFGDASAWSEVMARAIIIWCVFLVASAAFRHGAMIPLDFLRSMLPPRERRWLIRVATTGILTFLGILIWYGSALTERVLGQRVAMLDISVAWLYAALPVGALLAVPGVLLAHRDAVAKTEEEHVP